MASITTNNCECYSGSQWTDFGTATVTLTSNWEQNNNYTKNKDLEVAVHIGKIEKENEDYLFYLKTDKKLENGSLILDNNDIKVYFKYDPKNMESYSIKNKIDETEKVKCCECSSSTITEETALVALLNEDVFFYQVQVKKENIEKITEDYAIVSKMIINKRIFSDKQSENAPDPFVDIKYKVNKIITKKDTDGEKKEVVIYLTNPLWNSNSAYMNVTVSEEELNSTLTKTALSSILIEKINKAQTVVALINKLEEE